MRAFRITRGVLGADSGVIFETGDAVAPQHRSGGHRITFCEGCGRALRAATSFCEGCGRPVGVNGVASPAVSLPYAAPQDGVERLLVKEPPPAPMAGTAPQRRSRRVKRFVLGLAIGVAIGAVVRLLTGGGAGPGEAVAEVVARVSISQAGGSFGFDDGGRVTVPEGALSKTETFVVRRTTNDQEIRAVPADGEAPRIHSPGTLVAYAFAPTDVVFRRPVTLELPVEAGQEGVVFVSADGRVSFIERTGVGTIEVEVLSFDFTQGQSVFVTT